MNNSGGITIPMTIGAAYQVQQFDTYDGATEFTPLEQERVIVRTAGKVVPGDITILPVPSNYGKILWNGSVLTIV